MIIWQVNWRVVIRRDPNAFMGHFVVKVFICYCCTHWVMTWLDYGSRLAQLNVVWNLPVIGLWSCTWCVVSFTQKWSETLKIWVFMNTKTMPKTPFCNIFFKYHVWARRCCLCVNEFWIKADDMMLCHRDLIHTRKYQLPNIVKLASHCITLYLNGISVNMEGLDVQRTPFYYHRHCSDLAVSEKLW